MPALYDDVFVLMPGAFVPRLCIYFFYKKQYTGQSSGVQFGTTDKPVYEELD